MWISEILTEEYFGLEKIFSDDKGIECMHAYENNLIIR